MKRTATFILTAAMVFSLASCSESHSDPGTDISIVTQKIDNSTAPAENGNDPIDSIIDPTDKLTPAETIPQYLSKCEYNDFEYTAQSIRNDTDAKIYYYYDGSVKDDTVKEELFETLRKIFSQEEIKLKGTQDVQSGATIILTLKGRNGEKYMLCEAILTASPELEGGEKIYILRDANNHYTYLPAPYEESQMLLKLIDKGIQTQENLVRIKNYGDTKPETKKLSPNDIAFISVYSNAAWGRTIKGTYITKQGKMYEFDFSKTASGKFSSGFAYSILSLVCGSSENPPDYLLTDTDMIKIALEYAAQIDPNAKVTQEHKMCDYGQNTLYAIVDGKPVMLESKGDNDKTVEDVNAAKAIAAYNKVMRIDNDEF